MSVAQLITPNVDTSGAHGILFRRATVKDASTVAQQRYAMFREMGYTDEAALHAMKRRFLLWVESKLKSGQYLAWLATTEDGRVVAGAGLWLMDWPAHMLHSSSRRANILNVYTSPAYRRRGLARLLIEGAVYWCQANEIDYIVLHASEKGRGIYEKLGFKASNEMRLKIGRQ